MARGHRIIHTARLHRESIASAGSARARRSEIARAGMKSVRAMAARFIHMHHRSRSRTKHWRWAILITPHATNDRSPNTPAPSTMVCHWLYVRAASVQMRKSGKPIATPAANDPMKAMTDDTRMIQPTYAHITSPSCGHIQPCRFAAERWQSAARDNRRTTPPDFIASPLHCVVRHSLDTRNLH